MGVDDGLEVASPERQRWLIEQLAALIRRVGPAPLLHAPLVEPTPRFFPDAWQRDVAGAGAITRRLLDHARLESLELELEPFHNEAIDDDEHEERRYVVGFFRGIEGGVCQFGIHVPALDDPEYLAGVMAHEVAHAYRHHHRLAVEERAVEEELTDLTTVFLGSGCLTANLAERVIVERSPQYVSLRRSAGGYLSVEDFAFLIALQLRAREASDAEVERVEKFLGKSQAYCLRHALRELDDAGLDADALRGELGIGDEAIQAPHASGPPRPVVDLPGFSEPWGRLTFSAFPSRAVRFGVIGFGAGFVVGLCFARVSGGESMLFGLALGPLLGAVLGSRSKQGRCSEEDCRAAIPAGAEECPGCRRFVLGALPFPPARFNEGSNRRRRVRRLVGHRTKAFVAWGMLVSGALGVLLVGLTGSATYLLLPLLGALVGAAWGRRQRQDLCGGRECDAVVEPFVKVCPRCCAELWGEARSRLELL